jgi:hypothetical protein
MNFFTLPLADNILGSDPVVHLYKALTAAFPELGLTRANSKIIKIQPAVTDRDPTRTYLLIQKGNSPQDVHEFFYLRYDINHYLKNPIFDTAEALAAAQLQSSAKLVETIATKVNLNFRPSDFWTSISTLQFSGGTNPPNWHMRSVYNSVYWCGDMVVWLHT